MKDEMEEEEGSKGMGGGSSRGSRSEGAGQHERQDVMVYSAQEWGRRGQGVPCPQHQP